MSVLVQHWCQSWNNTGVSPGTTLVSVLVQHWCQSWYNTGVSPGTTLVSVLVQHWCQTYLVDEYWIMGYSMIGRVISLSLSSIVCARVTTADTSPGGVTWPLVTGSACCCALVLPCCLARHDHCVLRNWDRILGRTVKGLISRAGMVSICPLL